MERGNRWRWWVEQRCWRGGDTGHDISYPDGNARGDVNRIT
jgi:hypothetical protein